MTIAIIGGGLAGLSAALELNDSRQKFLLFEQSSELGGKLKTVQWSNFKLDLGFQVLLSAYPSLSKALTAEDFTQLSPCYFDAGAILLKDGKMYRLGDPLQDQKVFWDSLVCPLVSWPDKLRVLTLKQELKRPNFQEILHNEGWNKQSTLEFLAERGFSEAFVQNFAKPFFGGVFGDDSLKTKASCFAFCYKAFSEGKVFIPADGIGELPKLLERKLPGEMLRLNTPVIDIQKVPEDGSYKIVVEDGKYHLVSAVIIASDLENTCNLLGQNLPPEPRVNYHNLYYVSKVSLYADKKIFLNCNPGKLINNGVQISNISSKLSANPGVEHLISVTVLRNDLKASELPKACLKELEALFSASEGQIEFLKQFELSGAGSLLKQDPESIQALGEAARSMQIKLPQNVVLAGEFLTGNCSQETSIHSGKKAVERLLGKL